jgi:hypothetical protein
MGFGKRRTMAKARPVKGVMNRTEQAYANELESRRLSGDVASWMYEPAGLRLAANTTYNPDFLVVLQDGTTEWHEVKGFWRDDARVKIKVAATRFPFWRFIAVTKKAGAWIVEEFAPKGGGE